MTTPIRQRWANGETTLGGWLTIPGSVSAEITARAGFDYVCVDMQHGAVEYSDAVPMIQAVLLGGSSPIVRVPWNEPGIIGKMLDAGAHGVIVPMVNTVAEAEAVVRACRYAPAGARSFGPALAAQRADSAYVEWARDNVAVIPMIETEQAIEAIDDILAVGGIDAIYVGPADLSLTLGLPPGNNDDAPAFTDALDDIVSACSNAKVIAGIHSTGSLTPRRIEMGFHMITVTSDAVALRRGLADEVERARAASDAPSDGDLY